MPISTVPAGSIHPLHPVRERLALRLEGDDPNGAVALAKRLAPWFGVGKVGIDLLAGGGPAVVERLHDAGLAVFCDFKLHDIPDQVEASARAVARLGARYVTMHAAGGVAMLRAGLAGLDAGARDVGVAVPVALGVTVLTSDPDTSAFGSRLAAVLEAGCGGVVCSAHEAAAARAARADLVVVTPGIRPAAAAGDDQARAATPSIAVAAGADLLVVGRPVTHARDAEAAAAAIADEVGAALGAGSAKVAGPS
jgi:orotidine-5'-phosphate decarboxylase